VAEKSSDIAKRLILSGVAEGLTIEAATAAAGKSYKTYEYYRRTDKIFADKMDRTRLGLKDKNFASSDVHDLTFAEFRQTISPFSYLSTPAKPHRCNRG
jgi:hypothetical protein